MTLRRPSLLLAALLAARERPAFVSAVRALGGQAVAMETLPDAQSLADNPAFSAVLWWGGADQARMLAQALASGSGPLRPLITAMPDQAHVAHERHLCVDTTAAGGNAALLAG